MCVCLDGSLEKFALARDEAIQQLSTDAVMKAAAKKAIRDRSTIREEEQLHKIEEHDHSSDSSDKEETEDDKKEKKHRKSHHHHRKSHHQHGQSSPDVSSAPNSDRGGDSSIEGTPRTGRRSHSAERTRNRRPSSHHRSDDDRNQEKFTFSPQDLSDVPPLSSTRASITPGGGGISRFSTGTSEDFSETNLNSTFRDRRTTSAESSLRKDSSTLSSAKGASWLNEYGASFSSDKNAAAAISFLEEDD